MDRATILEEIEQNKINELRNQLTGNKAFNRKYTKYTSTNLIQQMLDSSAGIKQQIQGARQLFNAGATTASQTTISNDKGSGHHIQNQSINSGTIAGMNKVSVDLSSPSIQYSRAALQQLKESISHTPERQGSFQIPKMPKPEMNIQDVSRFNLNQKLSSVLDCSPLKNSYIGRMIHDRYQSHLQQPDGSLTLASILNETLSVLKGRLPNKPILKPLNHPIPQDASQQDRYD